MSAFRTLIYTRTTDLLRKLFLYSRFCKLIDTYISDLWLYMYVFQRIIKSTVFLAKTAVFVAFPHMQIQGRGMYNDIIYHFSFIILSNPYGALSVLCI